jgi:hypothetical protein
MNSCNTKLTIGEARVRIWRGPLNRWRISPETAYTTAKGHKRTSLGRRQALARRVSSWREVANYWRERAKTLLAFVAMAHSQSAGQHHRGAVRLGILLAVSLFAGARCCRFPLHPVFRNVVARRSVARIN